MSLMACTSPTAVDILGVEHHSIQVGVKSGEQFSLREKRNYIVGEKMAVKLKILGLKVKDGKVKLNVDLVLKQEGLILGLQPNIFGAKGFEKEIDANQKAGFAETEVDLTVVSPDNFIGEFIAQITIKDQHAGVRLTMLEIPFTVTKA